jgi:nucleoside-diphosphate-sugar epimerase
VAAGLVAVTGATGFVGRRLVPALTDRGWRVRALARVPKPGQWGGASPELIVGAMNDPLALAALTEGADAVIHAAGLIKATSRSAFFAVNEAGSRDLAVAAAAARIPRVVQISSLAAREPGLSDYAASKRAGETAARGVLGQRLTVARPPAIYGPGDRETLGLFQLAGWSPVLPIPGSAETRLALAHVDDVVGGLIALIEGAWVGGTVAFGGARPAGYRWREIFGAAAQAMNRSPALIHIPNWLLRCGGAAAETIGRLRGVPAIFNSGKVRELLHADWSVAEAELPPGAPAPCVDLTTGFARTVAWYRAEGWLA